MISETLKNRFWRKSLKAWAAEARAGAIDRREFLALATIFGASTAAAYGMLGLADADAGVRRNAQEGRNAQGRHVRQGPEGPAQLRLARDGQRRAPVPRFAGHLHPPVHLRAGAARILGRQRGCDRIRPARAQGRDLEQRRRLQRRRCDLQHQPLVRPVGRGQFDGRAHGRADRPGDQEGARGRDRQGRRSHRQAFAQEAGHHHHSRHDRLSGTDRPSRLTKRTARTSSSIRSAPGRSNSYRSKSARRPRSSGGRTASGGEATPTSTASSSSTTAPTFPPPSAPSNRRSSTAR